MESMDLGRQGYTLALSERTYDTHIVRYVGNAILIIYSKLAARSTCVVLPWSLHSSRLNPSLLTVASE